MTLTVNDKYEFDGPYDLETQAGSMLKDLSGVYLISKKNANGKYSRIDVGESHEVRTRILSHDRKPCWKGQARELFVSAYYCNEAERMKVEKELRGNFTLPCGKR